ncbi:hypothetical protein [Variovorax boronicumulans]
MTVKSMADLRNELFEVMHELRTSATPDLAKVRAYCEVATVTVNAIRTQVAYASIIKGDLELPFMEEPPSEPDRGAGSPAAPNPLVAGPSQDHPWRRVHRIGRT